MVVPGLEGPSSAAVTGFLGETHAALRARGAYQGASVFGIAAAAGDSIAQDVPAMAAVVDYLAPMVYPSHWGPGMYRVDSPINEPPAIVAKSLADFQRVTEGTGVRFLPVAPGLHALRRALRRRRGAGPDRRRQAPRASTASCCGTRTCATTRVRSPRSRTHEPSRRSVTRAG